MDYSRKILTDSLTFDNLLKNTSEEFLYSIYLGYYPEIKKMYKSPFQNEKSPSFTFYCSNNKLRFKDFSSGNTGTVVDLVMILYSLSYMESLLKINNDINGKLNIHTRDNSIINNNKSSNYNESIIEVVLKDYTQEDFDYWENYYFDINDLIHFDIKPCKEVWLNGKLWYSYNSKNPCYRYLFNGKYKIYKPLDTTYRWLSNCNNYDNIQGLKYLDYTTDTLIITKSFKDVACIKKHINYDSISFHGESHYIDQKIIDYFKKKYKRIYFLYDNDKPGIRDAKKLSEMYDIPYVYIPEEYLAKDISEFISTYGIHSAKIMLNSLIN